MTNQIIETSEFLKSLEVKFGKIRLITGLMGNWYSYHNKLFFDCQENDRNECAKKLFVNPDLDTLIVYFLVKNRDGYQLRDSRFKNIYDHNLKRMINHFHKVLEPSVKHGLQVGGLTYESCIGYGVKIIKHNRPTLANVDDIRQIIEKATGMKYKIINKPNNSEVNLIPNVVKQNDQIIITSVKILSDTIIIFGLKDKTLVKPNDDSSPEWKTYLKKVAWKDAMTLNVREKYYGILVIFDPHVVRYKVELNYPVEKKKLDMAFQALKEINNYK
jgi:hypothetical protein